MIKTKTLHPTEDSAIFTILSAGLEGANERINEDLGIDNSMMRLSGKGEWTGTGDKFKMALSVQDEITKKEGLLILTLTPKQLGAMLDLAPKDITKYGFIEFNW